MRVLCWCAHGFEPICAPKREPSPRSARKCLKKKAQFGGSKSTIFELHALERKPAEGAEFPEVSLTTTAVLAWQLFEADKIDAWLTLVTTRRERRCAYV
jgi:hypothetical protein